MLKPGTHFEVLLKFFLDFSNSWVSGSNMNVTGTAEAAAVALTCTPFRDTNDPTTAGVITAATSVYTVCQIRFFKRYFEIALVLSNNNNKVNSHYYSSMKISTTVFQKRYFSVESRSQCILLPQFSIAL